MKHIAIFKGIFFDFVLSGKKTIESRWSNKKIAPFNKVSVGDTILIKKTGCNVVASAKVKGVKYYNLTPALVEQIKLKYGKEICIDYFDDWEKYKNKKYCTLIWIEDVKKINELKVQKSHGAGWIVLN